MCIPVPESVSQWSDTLHTTDVTSESGDLLHFVEKNLPKHLVKFQSQIVASTTDVPH